MAPEILITICARGGSKGIPKKNIKPVNGKPLIAYTIEHATQFAQKHQADIGFSTDSMEILKVANQYNLKTGYIRSDFLATDSAGKLDAIKDLLLFEENNNNKRYDYIIDLDATSPLRTQHDLEAALNLLGSDPNALNIFSVSNAQRNPYFNMVEQKQGGYFGLVKSTNEILSRQSAPEVFQLNASIYIYRRAYFDLDIKTAISEKSLIYKMPHQCFDLDEQIDFQFMEYLLINNLLDFEL